MAIIETYGYLDSNRRPMMSGVANNKLAGTADYGNTSASWSPGNDTDKLNKASGEDPAIETVKWVSQSKFAGYMNTQLGYSRGRYLTGDFITGCGFKWRTYHNEDGGIQLIRWGIGIVSPTGTTRKRWSSSEMNKWSTSSSFTTERNTFQGELAQKFKEGWRFDELHFMIHTPKNNKTPGKSCTLEVKDFWFDFDDWKLNQYAIIPAVRSFDDRNKYAIANG